MKKALLSLTFLIAGGMSLLSQSLVTFDNGDWNFGDGIDRLVYMAPGTPVTDATMQAGLFENRGGTWTQLGALCPFFGDAVPGVWGWDGADRNTSVPNGQTTSLQVRIFNAGGTLLGQSAAFDFRNPGSQPPAPTDPLMINFRSFVVPEPSTIALGVLGLGALLLFRRRK